MKKYKKAARSGTANSIKKNITNIVPTQPLSRHYHEAYGQMKRQFLIDNPFTDYKQIEIACQHFKNLLGV